MKKSQTSIEFLFTYGWAILAISVSIGALAYFNISSPENIVPQWCDLGPQFSCIEYALFDNASLTLNITNNHNILIQITNITTYYISNQETYSVPFNISSGGMQQINVPVPQSAVSDINVKRLIVEVNFKNPNSDNSYVFFGTVNTGVVSSWITIFKYLNKRVKLWKIKEVK